MKLVLYSGGQNKSNHTLHEAISQIALPRAKKRKSPPSFTYIPFTNDGGTTYFNRAMRRYQRFGFKQFHYLPADISMRQSEINKCFNTDVIYLAGGNTFYFLHHLRKSGLLQKLKAFAKRGGIISGLSAGAIIMTPNINMADYPSFDRDDNQIGLRNFKGLGLVNFEIFPHHSQSSRLKDALKRYSKKSGRPLFGVEDGSGIIIDGEKKTFFGKVCVYHQGNQFQIS